jgi:hypothetical protein
MTKRHFAALASALLVAVCASRLAAAAPDLSGQWGRDMLFFEAPPSGPGPVMLAKRGEAGGLVSQIPCCGIVQTWFGDPNNSMLKPNAADAVKHFAELSLQGTVTPDLHSTCRPEPPPYVLGMHYGVLIVQKSDEVDLFYLLYNTVRRVRLASAHPKDVTPSWTGDSIGHYEGDTLVIDTVGVKVTPYSMVDGFGTPHSGALHVVERYRLIGGKAAADAQNRNGGTPTQTPTFARGVIDPDTSKPGLEVAFTVDDPNVFITPWSARVTYRRVTDVWPEAVCSENPREYYTGRDAPIPQTQIPVF